MFRYERAVRFAEVDAARVVFFGRFCDYFHDALEALFGSLEGGYPRLTMVDDVGVPTAHIEIDFKTPMRYGDVAVIDVDVLRIGRRSVIFQHTVTRKSDGVVAAIARQTVVTATMSGMQSVAIPGHVRALLERHLTVPSEGQRLG